MERTGPRRARSASAKQQRQRAILDAARSLAGERSVREVTLTDIAAAVGLHKSAMLRYFETREQIFLELTAEGWREWSAALRAELGALPAPGPRAVAALVARSLVARPLFCDLLAQAPLNLERNVSLDAARAFKRTALGEVASIVTVLGELLGLAGREATDVVSTATGMAGALWQMAAPGTGLRTLYESDPELAHAVVDVEPRLARILEALLTGMRTAGTAPAPDQGAGRRVGQAATSGTPTRSR
ncbi:TetR family transcriptional regulator [Streptomyces sp. NPDC059096]|uniref:TetR/AcrR family transcriptional regulator n=1 Tax=Streptomyces sp. NPDC059096 TaxID=3346727 RepID=UPI0036CE5014